jgi:hypothetical protein
LHPTSSLSPGDDAKSVDNIDSSNSESIQCDCLVDLESLSKADLEASDKEEGDSYTSKSCKETLAKVIDWISLFFQA